MLKWQVVRVMVEVLQDFALERQSKYEIAISYSTKSPVRIYEITGSYVYEITDSYSMNR